MRRCFKCKEVKDLERDYYPAPKALPGSRFPRNLPCKRCIDLYRLDLYHRNGERELAKRREYAKRYAERHPERIREKRKEAWARLKADPDRHAELLENQRIDRRLRAEREGRPFRQIKPRVLLSDPSPELPARPLAVALDALAAKLEGGIEELAVQVGFSSRSYRGWRSGERATVRFDLADKILVAAGLEWWDVWSEDEHPSVHERLAA